MIRLDSLLRCLVVVLATMPGVANAQAREVPDTVDQITLSFAPLVQRAAPAVVNIYAQRTVQQRISPLFDDPFFQRFFGPNMRLPNRERVENSLGSGVIVSAEGLVVTNHHVIENADQIRVVLADRSEFVADIALSDERTDLAVLRLRELGGRELPLLSLADSDGLLVGDLVLAIGNPFGVGQTVTSGIVSALARTAVGITDYNFFIQTDAAINPGNSGGALIDMQGNLVGINTAIFSRSGGSQGIGFAVPANMVRAVIAAAERGTAVSRPWLGAEGQVITAEIAQSMDLEVPSGVLINGLHPLGPATEAGLQVGDVILAVNGREVQDPEALRFRIATQPLGEQVTLSVLRDGLAQELQVDVELPPEVPPRNATPIGGRNPLSGAVVGNLSPAVRDELGLQTVAASGVVILDMQPGTVADRVGLEIGDVILRLNGAVIDRVETLVDVLRRGTGGRWPIAIRRGDRVLEDIL